MTGEPAQAPDAPPEAPAADRGRDLVVSLTVLAVGAAVVAFLTMYNAQAGSLRLHGTGRSWEEYLVVNTGCLLFAPWLAVLAALREPADRFGWRAPEKGSGRIALGLFLLMVPPMLLASRLPEFRAYYPLQPDAAYSWSFLAYSQLAYGFYMLAWEWFYRGFLTMGLARRFGPVAAVVTQAAAFGLMHWGKPMPEFAGSFAAGLALGWLALRARSFLPGFWLHWAVSVGFDLLCIRGRPGALF